MLRQLTAARPGLRAVVLRQRALLGLVIHLDQVTSEVAADRIRLLLAYTSPQTHCKKLCCIPKNI